MDQIAHGRDEYRDTFITVAADCPTSTPVVPEPYRGRRTVAMIQYELLADAPYRWRHSDVLVLTVLGQRGVEAPADDELAAFREEYFAQPRACLRSSPLPKRFGWGVHFDREGRCALYGVGTPDYERFASGSIDGVKLLRAMRTSRR